MSKMVWQDQPSTPLKFLLVCLMTTAIVLALVGFYLAVVWAMGLFSHPAIEIWHFWTGGTLTVLMSVVAVIMGESLIEDIVKFTLIAIAAPVILNTLGPCAFTIYLGSVVGLSIPLLLRTVSRI